ncbi:MAG: 50S ribosomal protein L30 [Bacteroidetes bacterium]|nr:50S ribosomal protein L30 [Bacteroidota bacterium]MDA1333453.1 50S ribosomal protein L30 [Bacteroidota bacterium]
MAKLKITQIKSAIRRPGTQKKTVAALGLRRLNQTVEHEDSPQIRGMLAKVHHLIKVESA